MVKTSIKTSITNSKAIPVATKFSVSYVRVSTKAQTKEDKSGIERQEQDYLNFFFSNYLYLPQEISYPLLQLSLRNHNLQSLFQDIQLVSKILKDVY